MEIRKYESCDLKEIVQIFYGTINAVNIRDYTSEQVKAWSSASDRLLKSDGFFRSLYTLVAVDGGMIAGYGNISEDGYLDHLYVHKDRQGMGVATAICDRLESHAEDLNCPLITVHASITAKSFFERRGYTTVRENIVTIGNAYLKNYFMEKKTGLGRRQNLNLYK